MKIIHFIAMTINDYYVNTLQHTIMLFLYGLNKKTLKQSRIEYKWF